MSNYPKKITTEKLRGIDIVVKSISKIYPFIKGWQFNDRFEEWETLIAIDFFVDYEEFANYWGEEKIFKYKYKTKKLSLTDTVKHEFYDETDNLSKNIKKLAESLYESLPENMVFKWGDEVCRLSPSFFLEFKSTESFQG